MNTFFLTTCLLKLSLSTNPHHSSALNTPVNPGGQSNNIITGTYSWISQDDDIYTLYVCSGNNKDPKIYAGISRDIENDDDINDGEISFTTIIARANGVHVNSDGRTASFNGFKAKKTKGVKNVHFVLIYSKCDDLYQMEYNDETYTLRKISNSVSDPNKCWRPSQKSWKSLPKITQFQSNPLPHKPKYVQLHTYINNKKPKPSKKPTNYKNNDSDDDDNDDDFKGCWSHRNINTDIDDDKKGILWGNKHKQGSLEWENRLLIDSWDLDDDDDKKRYKGCKKGIEFAMVTDDGIYCSWRCINKPTIGSSGKLKYKPNPKIGADYCDKKIPKKTTKPPTTKNPTRTPKKPFYPPKKSPTTTTTTKPPTTKEPTRVPKKPFFPQKYPPKKPVTTDASSAETTTTTIQPSKPTKTWVKKPKPTTKTPTTKAPTTKAPTKKAQIWVKKPKPTTKAPTTKAPTTKAPTTKAPTTKAPTTKAPTTKTTKKPIYYYRDPVKDTTTEHRNARHYRAPRIVDYGK